VRLSPWPVVVAIGAALLPAAVAAEMLPAYRIEATVARTAPQLRGTVETTVTNRGARPLDAVVLVLFANRFSTPDADAAVTDVNRPFVYPYEDFDPGSTALGDVVVDGRPARTAPLPRAGVPDGCLVRVALPAPLRPGGTTSIRVGFTTVVPTRFGSFGTFEGMLTAVGGWYPSLATMRADGTPALDGLPERADFDVVLHVDPALEVVLNGTHVAHPEGPVHTTVRGVHYLSLVAAPTLLRDDVDADGTHVVLLRRPPVRAVRHAFGPSQLEITRAALERVVAGRPATVPGRDELIVVEAPLRLDLSAPGEGMVVLSDRALKVFPPIRPFHEQQLAQATYAELLRPGLAPHEPAADYPWVSEGLSYEAARTYRRAQTRVRSVQEWIDLLNVFAIVDRFETAPKIPFVGAFFERAPTADPLHEQLATFAVDQPPGHVILAKLRQQIGDERFARVVERCSAGRAAFRACAAQEAGTDLGPFFGQWLQPYPEINYDFAALALNAPRADGRWDSAVTVRRTASRDVHEPVDVELQARGGDDVRLRWDGRGDEGQVAATTSRPVHRAVIDPDRKLIETTRADDARPPVPQVVFDSAAVEVSSTEFGFSGLLVGRYRYDYTKDVAAAGFYTNRSVGIDVGPRLHWGTQNDPTLYRNNLYLFYDAQALNGSFHQDGRPDVHTRGHLSGVGLRYDYNDLVAFDNPTRSIDARLFADGYDGALGSTYDYADWGGSVVEIGRASCRERV